MKLFQPVTIKSMVCKNRILRSATWEALSDHDGYMSEKQFAIYRELAKNKVGLICTGYARICRDEYPNAGMMGIYDDSFIPQYKRLTDMVHEYGGAIMMQIAYGGTKTTYKTEGRIIFAPGNIPERSTNLSGVPMTVSDIQDLVGQYADAAERVKRSGFDAVEIHGGHSYLLNQFLSPYYNDRDDEYGGSLENRYRIVDEIIKAIREKVGNEYPIAIKITCSDFFENGLSFRESLAICQMLERSGIDLIEVSGNIHGKAQKMIGQEFDGHTIRKDGYFYEYAREIADAVKVPVYVTGGFGNPEIMETYLHESAIEGFGISRALLCEPDLADRWISGDMIPAKCLHCSQCRTPEGNYCTVFHGK